MKFYCQDCGKLYQKCSCTVYMSAYRSGVTRPLPEDAKRGKTGSMASVGSGGGILEDNEIPD